MRAEAGDDEHEDPRQQHLRGVEQRLDAGQPHPGVAHATGLAGIPGEEVLLAADAAQDPQPGDGVGAERREPARLLALRLLPLLERAA